jgi:hypothetical protein
MIVPRKRPRKQLPNTSVPPDVELTCPDNDPEPVPPGLPPGPTPDICPTCGRPYFGPASSALLDLVVLTHESLGKTKAALETVVVP